MAYIGTSGDMSFTANKFAVTSAQSSADAALSSASGKSTNYYGNDEPTDGKEGDLWFKFSDTDGTLIYQYNDGQWKLSQFGNAVFSNIDAGKITTGILKGIEFQAFNLDWGMTLTINGQGLSWGNGEFTVMEFTLQNMGEGADLDLYNGSLSCNYIEAMGAITAHDNITTTEEIHASGKIISGNVYMNGANSIFNDSETLYLNGNGGVEIKDTSSTDSFLCVSNDSTGGRVYSDSFLNRGYTGAANALITTSGTIGMTSSASRYKLDQEPISDDLPRRVLNIVPKTWYDKNSVEAYATLLDKQAKGEIVDWEKEDIPYIERIPGVVAEDVESAGLSQFVIYTDPDEDGNRQTQSVMYDRLPILFIPILKDHENKIANIEDILSRNAIK